MKEIIMKNVIIKSNIRNRKTKNIFAYKWQQFRFTERKYQNL